MKLNDVFKDNIRQYAAITLVPVVLLLCTIAAKNYFGAKEEMAQLDQELTELRQQVETFESNKQKLQGDLDQYNNLLLSIIPEKEDYFSIMVALEKLSLDTGFRIDKYTILLSETNAEKLSLSIEGIGDPNSFLKFLKQYQYEGGRLITNEKMEFSTSNTGMTKLSLNFYHKSVSASEQKIEQISVKDVNVLRDVQQKVVLDIKESAVEEAGTYETKPNPF